MDYELPLSAIYAAAIREYRRELLTALDMEDRLSKENPHRQQFSSMSKEIAQRIDYVDKLYQLETGESFFSDEV